MGGIESYLRHVSKELARGHELTVLSARIDDGPHTRLSDSVMPPTTFDPFDDGAVKVQPLRIPLGRRALMSPLVAHVTPGLRRYAFGRSRVAAAGIVARAVAPLIAREARGMDIIHMWAGDLLASAALRAGRQAGVPVVVTPFAHEGQWGYDPASVAAYRRSDAVIALLEVEAELYRSLGIPRDQIQVSGVCSPGVQQLDRAAARRELGISGPLVLFLGVRRAYKGFDLLLDAAPLVAAQLPDVTFGFVGPGPGVGADLGGARVIDAGRVSDDERAKWLNAADILCLPSEAEIFPISILEAWSVGTPVITSDIPTLRELIGRTGGGRCTARGADPLAQALLEALSDRESLERMGDAGRAAWQERFRPQVLGTFHERVYTEVVDEATRQTSGRTRSIARIPLRR